MVWSGLCILKIFFHTGVSYSYSFDLLGLALPLKEERRESSSFSSNLTVTAGFLYPHSRVLQLPFLRMSLFCLYFKVVNILSSCSFLPPTYSHKNNLFFLSTAIYIRTKTGTVHSPLIPHVSPRLTLSSYTLFFIIYTINCSKYRRVQNLS